MRNEFIFRNGTYEYKDYFILLDIENNLKKITISRDQNKRMEEIDIENIAMHFIGENYSIKNNDINFYIYELEEENYD